VRPVARIQQNVGGLDVAVNDARRVQVRERYSEARAVVLHLLHGQSTL